MNFKNYLNLFSPVVFFTSLLSSLFFCCTTPQLTAELIENMIIENVVMNDTIIKNSTNKKVRLKLLYSLKCPSCSDCNNWEKSITLKPQERKQAGTYGQVIQNIHLLNTDDYFLEPKENTDGSTTLTIKIRKKIPPYKTFIESIILGKHANHPQYLLTLPPEMDTTSFLEQLHVLYQKNNLLQVKISKNNKYKIPRIIHQIWFGLTGDVPNSYRKWQKTWKQKNPGWRHICWSHALVKKHFPQGLFNQKTFDMAQEDRNHAKMADVLRYEIISRYGGFYGDMDAACLRSMEILHKTYDFYSVLEPLPYPCYLSPATFGAKAKHPVIIGCLNYIKKYENGNYESSWPKNNRNELTILTTGPGNFSHSFSRFSNKERNIDVIFPPQYCPTWSPNNLTFPQEYCPPQVDIYNKFPPFYHPIKNTATCEYLPFFTHYFHNTWVK